MEKKVSISIKQKQMQKAEIKHSIIKEIQIKVMNFEFRKYDFYLLSVYN